MSDTVLTLENVTKKFVDITAANNINIDVGQTEFFALLGPSGSAMGGVLFAFLGGLYILLKTGVMCLDYRG